VCCDLRICSDTIRAFAVAGGKARASAISLCRACGRLIERVGAGAFAPREIFFTPARQFRCRGRPFRDGPGQPRRAAGGARQPTSKDYAETIAANAALLTVKAVKYIVGESH